MVTCVVALSGDGLEDMRAIADYTYGAAGVPSLDDLEWNGRLRTLAGLEFGSR